MRRGRSLPLALVLASMAVAVGLGAWWLQPTEAPEVGADAIGAEAVGTVEAPGAALAGARGGRMAAPVASGRGCVMEVEVSRGGKPEAGRLLLFERSRQAPGAPFALQAEPAEGLLPIEGVHDAEPVAVAAAGADGRGVFERVPLGTYDVVVVTEDGRSATDMAWFTVDGQRVRVRLEVRAGHEVLRGRVLHADGRPFHGLVGAVGEHDTHAPLGPHPAEVGPDGRFELTGLDRGVLRVVAWTPGRFAVRTLSLVLPRPGELVIVVDRDMSERNGRVLADRDGRPVSGAVVVASTDTLAGLTYVEARAVTDAEGRFRLLVPATGVELAVRAAGYVPYAGSRWFGAAEVTEVRLLRPGTVRGRVLAAADGTPVADVPVFVSPYGDGALAAGLSGPDGRYEVTGVTPTESSVFACGGGWVSKDFVTANPNGYDPLRALPQTEGTLVVDLQVVPSHPVRGRVVDSGGAGVPGCLVDATPTLAGDRKPPLWAEGPSRLASATDATGAFVVTSLPPGLLATFEARAPSGATGKAGPIRLEGADLEPILIRMSEPRFAEVTVLDEASVPLAGVGLDVFQTQGRDGWSWLVDGHTGADGVARLGPLPPGEIEIDPWCEAFTGPDTLAGGPEGSTEPIRVTMTMTRRRRVAGVVRWSDGSPAADARVALIEPEPHPSESTTETGPSGTFVFDDVSASEVSLRVGGPSEEGAVVLEHVAADRDDLEITLKGTPPPRLVITVLDPDGRPVPAATVQLDGGDHHVDHGRVELDVLDEGAYGFVRLPRTEMGQPLPCACTPFGPVPAGALTYEVRLLPESTIEGTVVDPGGSGVRGVRVKAYVHGLEHLPGHTPWVSVVPTDDAGRFRLGALGPGKYRLSVDAPPSYAPAPPVEVLGGARDVRIVLLAGLERSPVVTDSNGRPVAHAFVSAKSKGGQTLYADSDRDGRARLVGLEAEGEYTLSVAPPFDRTDLLPYRQEGWKPSNDPIRLSRAFAVSGYVRDADGRFVAGAQVTAWASGGTKLEQRTDALGRFSFERLPDGEVSLLARLESPARVGRKTTCKAGAQGVVLALDATASIRLRLASPAPFEPESTLALVDEETGQNTDEATIGADGRVDVSGVHPKATYALRFVLRPDEGPPLVAIRAGLRVGEAETVVPLEPGLHIEGRVVAAGGADLTESTVTVHRGVLRWSLELGGDGRFVLDDLSPGTWTLSARLRDGSQRGSVEVEAGVPVEIRLLPSR